VDQQFLLGSIILQETPRDWHRLVIGTFPGDQKLPLVITFPGAISLPGVHLSWRSTASVGSHLFLGYAVESTVPSGGQPLVLSGILLGISDSSWSQLFWDMPKVLHGVSSSGISYSSWS